MRNASKHLCVRTGAADKLLRHRRGFVLLVVTIVLILLSLAAWAYTNKMVIKEIATMMYGRDSVEARMAAESAIEYTAIQIGNLQKDSTLDVFHNPTLFRGQIMEQVEDNPRGQCGFGPGSQRTVFSQRDFGSVRSCP